MSPTRFSVKRALSARPRGLRPLIDGFSLAAFGRKIGAGRGGRSTRWAYTALLLGLALGGAGCSSFNRDWAMAGHSAAPDSIEGRWEGKWRSEVNGHADRLRCLVSRTTNDIYRARFQAKYRAVFRVTFGYTVPLTVERQPPGDGVRFEGSANLGALAGGRYTYHGHATATNFISTYSCKYDHGLLELTRPPSAR